MTQAEATPLSAAPARSVAWGVLEAGSALALFIYLVGPWRTDPVDMAVLATAALILWLGRARFLPPPPPRRNDPVAARGLVAFTLVSALGLCVYGWLLRGHPFRPLTVGVTLLVYVPYAFVQQYLTQRYLAGRLCVFLCRGSRAAIPLLSGALFGICHLPWPAIHAVTTVAGAVWTWSWLRTGRVWDLALSQAVLATALFCIAWGYDPLGPWLASSGR